MVAPLAPHVAEELWRKLGHDETITYVDFPVADEQYSSTTPSRSRSRSTARSAAGSTVAADADQATMRGGRAGRRAGRRCARRRHPEEGHRRAGPHGQRRRLSIHVTGVRHIRACPTAHSIDRWKCWSAGSLRPNVTWVCGAGAEAASGSRRRWRSPRRR